MSISNESIRLKLLEAVFSANLPERSLKPITVSVKDCDDAAVIQISNQESLIVTSDFIRGPHFYLAELGYLSYFDLGYYLVIANLSDIAAMGALPLGITTIIRYADDVTDDQFSEIVRGIKSAADLNGVSIIGGDIGGYRATVLAATALGLAKTGKVLLRSSAQKGDLLCITGNIGTPITALLYFKEWKSDAFCFSEEDEQFLLKSWQRPTARLREGHLLAKVGIHACQDISDGLKATIQQLSKASGVFFTVEASALPVHSTTRRLAEYARSDAVQIAMSASVDFELAFTATEDQIPVLREGFQELGTGFSVVGQTNEMGRNLLKRADGSITEIPGTVWQQQVTDYLKEIVAGGGGV